jgi:hypothetical protein
VRRRQTNSEIKNKKEEDTYRKIFKRTSRKRKSKRRGRQGKKRGGGIEI